MRGNDGIAPSPEIYDYNTGKPIGLQAAELTSALPALAAPTVEAEVVPPKNEDDVIILDYRAEVPGAAPFTTGC